ncbi:hypothetical protein [Stygiolobus azoricus]|nr:hypothetical protein [Stygiolobus azoricus]
MAKMALITLTPCKGDVIEFLNLLSVDYIIGLGDVECPQYISNYYGILGEMDNVTTQKYLRQKNKLITKTFGNLSIDFSTKIVITHFQPRTSYGSQVILGKILSESPELLIHGHLRSQKEYNVVKTRVYSAGSLEEGYYLIFDSSNNSVELERASH